MCFAKVTASAHGKRWETGSGKYVFDQQGLGLVRPPFARLSKLNDVKTKAGGCQCGTETSRSKNVQKRLAHPRFMLRWGWRDGDVSNTLLASTGSWFHVRCRNTND